MWLLVREYVLHLIWGEAKHAADDCHPFSKSQHREPCAGCTVFLERTWLVMDITKGLRLLFVLVRVSSAT